MLALVVYSSIPTQECLFWCRKGVYIDYSVQLFKQLSPANLQRRRSAETKKQCWNKNMMDSWDGDDNDDVEIMIVMLTMLKWWWHWWQWWPWQWFWQQETERRPWDAANLWVPSNPDHYERLGTCHKTPPTHTIMAKLSNVDEVVPKPWHETCLKEKIAPYSWTLDQQVVLMILVELMMILWNLINPVILTLVMVDHHFGDEDCSGDDHRSYDDDHWSLWWWRSRRRWCPSGSLWPRLTGRSGPDTSHQPAHARHH